MNQNPVSKWIAAWFLEVLRLDYTFSSSRTSDISGQLLLYCIFKPENMLNVTTQL